MCKFIRIPPWLAKKLLSIQCKFQFCLNVALLQEKLFFVNDLNGSRALSEGRVEPSFVDNRSINRRSVLGALFAEGPIR
jgi:hypothetical protein